MGTCLVPDSTTPFPVELVRVKRADSDDWTGWLSDAWDRISGQVTGAAKQYAPAVGRWLLGEAIATARSWSRPPVSVRVDARPVIAQAAKEVAETGRVTRETLAELQKQIGALGGEGEKVLQTLAQVFQQAKQELAGSGQAVSDLTRTLKPELRRAGTALRRGAVSIMKLLEGIRGPAVETAHAVAEAAPELKNTIRDWGSTARVIKYTVPAAALGALGIWLYNSIQRNKRKRREQRMWKRLVDWVTKHELQLARPHNPQLKVAAFERSSTVNRYLYALVKQAALHEDDEDEKKEKDKLTWFEWLSRGAVPGLAYWAGVPAAAGLGGLAGGTLAAQLGYTEPAERVFDMSPETRKAIGEMAREQGHDVSEDDIQAIAKYQVPSRAWLYGGAAAGGLAGIYLIYKLLKAYRNAARKRQRRIEE